MLENSETQTDGGDLYLGTLLGRRQAFTTIAARCTAADAAALREIRDTRAYHSLSASFEEFCSKHLGVSERHANRLIHYLNEFGPAYFELAQLTGISPSEYRAIAPAVKDEAVHCGDEVIALLPENAEKLAAAVAQLRASAPIPARKPLSIEQRLRHLERQAGRLTGALRALIPAADSIAQRARLASILGATHQSLEQLERELGRVG
ncbi:MAG TPA: hypothetical protein VGF16_00925 [Bryobacteraceae bacterium]|jgi:hypothetical protein